MNDLLGPMFEEENAEPSEVKTEKFAKDFVEEFTENPEVEIVYPEG